MKRLMGVLLAVSAAFLAGCAGVPSSSQPQIVQPIRIGTARHPRIHPVPGEDARSIVHRFLAANAFDPVSHASARTFLTQAARARWNDGTATIVDNDISVGSYRHGHVVVTAHEVGTLDEDGIFTPTAQGGGALPFRYGITRVKGQYRIGDPYKGLVLTVDQFESAYQSPRSLYFFDLANKYLVPDARWSALSGTALETWLVQQIATGPSAGLQNAVNSDTMPAKVDTNNLAVTQNGALTTIKIPGASQLDGNARNQLAAQIATTLDGVSLGARFQIYDSVTGRPLIIPKTTTTSFTALDFPGLDGPEQPSADVYYVRAGRIVAVNPGYRNLDGPLNHGTFGLLHSIALAQTTPTSPLLAAGIAENHLLVGKRGTGFVKLPIAGQDLTRPAWDPGQDEVWVGDGDKLYRVQYSGGTTKVSTVPLQVSVGSKFSITALRFSPEGDRVALIIRAAGEEDSALYVGSIARNAGQVRVATTQISPPGVSVTDVAWEESLKLTAIGDIDSSGGRIFETYVDGSDWVANLPGTLPQPLESITAVPGQSVWVSAQGLVFSQSGALWTSHGHGTAPVYLE